MNTKLCLLSLSVFFFSNIVKAQSTLDVIKEYYQKQGLLTQKNSSSDKTDIIILNEDNSKSLGVNIVNIQQTFNGIRVYNGLGKVLIKEGKIFSEKNAFSRNITIAGLKQSKAQFSEEILKQRLGLKEAVNITYLPDIYFENNGVFILAKELMVKDKSSSDVWYVVAEAETGEVLQKINQTHYCNFNNISDNVRIKPGLELVSSVEINKEYKTLLPPGASYHVFALPHEAPSFGSRSIVNNPWDQTASPEGWHSDGTNNYTNTQGNNAYAYSDQDNADTPGYSPDGGSNLNFNFPFADGRYENPMAYRDAAITNLFYMNNKLHDIFYRFGFTETARNFQTNNFDKGGIGNDAVRAEAFDGSGLNNAFFNSGYEMMVNGTPFSEAPRMQMYLWDRIETANDPIIRYQYNSPASMVNRPTAITAGADFGSLLLSGQTVTGDVMLSIPDEACSPLVAGSMNGKIGFAKRGTCSYASKVKRMEEAGAIGTIIYNPLSVIPFTMPNDNTVGPINIPSIMMGKIEGENLMNQLNSGVTVNVTLNFDYKGFKHSSLDNGIVTHEFGHGISDRLTGQGYNCLNSAEQMGEGWSDYFALLLTARPGDTSGVARGLGTYMNGESTTGGGIRMVKYSPDFTVNNYTYAKTNEAFNSHEIGFVWATMLWDLTWKYVEKYGYNSDVIASTTSGNARVLQIIMDGLKLQSCNPSFIDARNAILEADAIGNAGADQCMIWNTFAKRGLGLGASAGADNISDDQVEDFTVPQECIVTVASKAAKEEERKFVVFPNPTYDEFFVGNIDHSSKEVKIRVFDIYGKLIFSDSRDSISKKAISTKGFVKGIYMVHIQQGNKVQTEKLIVR